VKSHIGIVGNETADKTAVGVANGTLYEYERSEDNNNQHDDSTTSSDSSDEDERAPKNTWQPAPRSSSRLVALLYIYEHSNDRADQYWPHHQDIMLPTKQGKEQAEPTTVYAAIPNMAESLKSNNMHHCRKIGMSDTSTVTYYYDSSWQSSKLIVMDEAHSHAHVHDQQQSDTNTTKTCAAVSLWTTAHQQTAIYIYRYKKVKSTACPLCGGEDVGHHAVSSCPSSPE
jgi:hypothetical protein